MTCKHGETGILCAWCDAELIRNFQSDTLDLANLVANAQENDKRTDEEKINDGAAFLRDTRICGE